MYLRTICRATCLFLFLIFSEQLLAQAPILIGDTLVCIGQTNSYEIINPPSGGVDWDNSLFPTANVIFIDTNHISFVWREHGSFILTAVDRQGVSYTLPITIAATPSIEVFSPAAIECADDNTGKSVAQAFCLGDTVSFFVSPFAVGDVVDWNLSNTVYEISRAADSVCVVFSSAGSFTIEATVTSSAGCTDAYLYEGEVLEIPNTEIATATHGIQDTFRICRNQTLDFSYLDPAGGPYFPRWQLSTGEIETQESFSYMFSDANIYNLILYLQNGCGCERAVDTVTVLVDPGEQFEILCPDVVCSGQTATYTIDLTQGQGVSCQQVTWDASPYGTISGSGTSVSISWANVTSTTIGQVVITPDTSCGGCSLPTIIDVPIIGTDANITLDPVNCHTGVNVISVPDLQGVSYSWSIVEEIPVGNIVAHTGVNAASSTVVLGTTGTASVRVEMDFNNGACTARDTVELVRSPQLFLSNPYCLGDSIFLIGNPVYTGAGSFDYSYGNNNSATANYTTLPAYVGDAINGINEVLISNVTIEGVSTNQCDIALEVDIVVPPPITQLIGPDVICAGGEYQYGADPSLPGIIHWDIVGGSFQNGTSTTTGQTILASWDMNGPYELSARRFFNGCFSDSVSISPMAIINPQAFIVGDTTPCADAGVRQIYQVVCGTMNPCMAGQNYEWSIDPAFGSVVSGQNSATVEVLWHIPASGIPNTAIQVSYSLCGQDYDASLPIVLQFPSEVEVTGTSVGCAGDVFVFEVDSNSNLAVSSVEWVIVDQVGQTYTVVFTGPTATTLSANTALLQPEIAPGFARVTARVTYSNGCTIEDVGSHDFEILLNPEPQVSVISNDDACDENGNPIPTEVTFVTSTSGGASDVFFVWERICFSDGIGVTDTVASGLGVGSINVLVSPTKPCCYQVRTSRDYVRKGQHYVCERVSACESFLWNCDANCGGYCPEIVLIDNTAPSGDLMPTCGRVDLRANTFDCEGNVINIQTEQPTFGSWTVSPTPDPLLAIEPGASIDPVGIDGFSNRVVTFETFTKPLVYTFEYYLEKDNATPAPKCGGDQEQVEITLVPHMGYVARCNATDDDVYQLQLQDVTDVIDSATIINYQWTISDINGQIAQSSLANDFVNIPARAQSYDIEICLQPTANQVWVNQGAPYSCQVCETLTIPGRPISDFSVAASGVCAGTAFQFTYTNPQDPGSTFFWDFGDSTYSYQANPTKVYAETDTLIATLVHTNSLGCTSTTRRAVLIRADNLSGTLEVDLNEPCEVSATLAFVRDPSTNRVPPYIYDWSPVVTAGNSMAIDVDASGVYSVSVVDGNGCLFEAAPVGVNLNEAFYGDIEIESPLCFTSGDVNFTFAGSDDYEYIYQINGSTRGAAFANSNNSFLRSIAGAGTNRLTILARSLSANGTIQICDSLNVEFILNAPPAPPVIELVEVTCEPSWSVTYQTVDGSVVSWIGSGSTLGIGASITVYSNLGGSTISALRSGFSCPSEQSNFLMVPQSPEANIVTGCYADCDDRPLELEELSRGNYSYWEWIFIPDGSSNPASCTAPGPGTGQVDPWPNYYDNCGNGTYLLRTAQVLPNGDTCFSETDELCIICTDSISCEGPTWIAQNIVCQASPVAGFELYYINFHAFKNTGDAGIQPCVDGIIVDGAEFGSELYLTEGNNAFNLESTILIPHGNTVDDVCIYIPYVQAGDACSSNSYCITEVFCLAGAIIEASDQCEKESCNDLPAIGNITFDCPGGQGNSAVVGVTITDIVFQVPQGCTGFKAKLYGGTGQSSDLNPGGERYNLDGVLDAAAGTFTIDEIGYNLIVHQGARLACLRFEISCGGDDLDCASSICYELPVDCTPDDLPDFVPEVSCNGQSDGMNLYNAYIPFGEQAPEGEDGWTVISSTFGISTELSEAQESFASIEISAPAGLVGSWILFGDPSLEREEFVISDLSEKESKSILLPTEGDIIRYIRFPDCNGMQSRSAWTSKSASGEHVSSPSIKVAPNPAADRITLTGVFPKGGRLNWQSLQIISIDGKQQSAASIVQSDDRGELLLETLAPGWYAVSILTESGVRLQAYFIKQ